MVGVVLAEGVELGLVEIVWGAVGVGVGVGDELQPLRSNTNAPVEAANTAEILRPVIQQIYLLLVQVKMRAAL